MPASSRMSQILVSPASGKFSCWPPEVPQCSYGDGTHLAQFDAETMAFHRFGEIDLGRLDVFALHAAFAPALRFELPVRDGTRPIHFYRNRILNAGTPDEARVRVYCFGFQRTVGGRNVKTILEVHTTGVVMLVED